LQQGSGQLYFLDEGVNVGVIPQDLVLGGMTPAVEAYSQKTTLDRVSVIQMLFPSLTAKELPQRVSSCNRPGGKLNITEQDAKEVLKRWKEAMEEAWNKGWDDESDGEVQFVSVYDETSVVGTTGRLLDEITLQSGRIMIISMAVLVILSTLFFFNFDLLESRLVLSLVGVALIVLSFLAATGFTILVGIRIDVKVAWTLPFVLIGIGVDIVFIVLMAVQKQGGLDELSYLRTMRETVVPVSMASLVNVCMFATMTLSDIPALYLTAQVAVAVIIAVYVAVIFCFPAYCYLDIRRQASGRFDILYCRKIKDPPQEGKSEDWRNRALFNFFYQPIVLGSNRRLRLFAHAVIFLCSAVLLVVAICGITQREVAAGPEDLFPSTHSAYHWATVRQQDIVASAAITMNWGEIQYTSPNVQMKMIKQFEDLVTSPNFDQHDTQNLWIARFLLWTTRHCDENFDLSSTVNKCGRDQFHNDSESHCAGAWVENKFELRETTVKLAGDSCNPYRGGICRPVSQMHRDDLAEMFLTLSSDDEGQSFCPVIDDWSNSKWQFCMEQWHRITGAGGQFVQNNAAQSSRTRQQCTEGDFDVDDETILWPIKHSASPAVLSFGRVSKDGIQEILEMTRAICDADTDIHCWMSGVSYH
jgi:Patched family